jgi:hypothetical protein
MATIKAHKQANGMTRYTVCRAFNVTMRFVATSST